MKNDLYRKLTSITLMTIMFAGGMTIAIPGETPVAVAQTGMLSVSATAAPDNSFGAQVIEIVVDDPSRSETTGVSQPHVTADGDDGDDGASRHRKVVCVCCSSQDLVDLIRHFTLSLLALPQLTFWIMLQGY